MSASVCRYFLNGNCRFGDRCRYSHDVSSSSYDSSGYSSHSSHNPYVLNRNPPNDRRNYSEPKQNWRQYISYNDIQEIAEKIREEAKQVEYEKLWPLTCLSVLKEASNVPGWDDYSMEELRVAAYSAKKAGRFDEYVHFYGNLLQKARDARSIFLPPGKRAEEVVRIMFEKRNQNGSKPSSASNFSFAQIPAFSGMNSSGSGAGSIFGGSSTLVPGSAFGSTPFGAGGSDPASGLFAMAAQGFASNASQGSVLNDTDMETASESLLNQTSTSEVSAFQQNILGQAGQSSALHTASVFGGSTVTPSVFGGSPEKTGIVNVSSSSVFGGASGTSNVFGGVPATSSVIGSVTNSSVFGGSSSVFGGPAASPISSSPGDESPDWEEKRPRHHKKRKKRYRSSNRSRSRSRSRSTSQSKLRSHSRSWSRCRRSQSRSRSSSRGRHEYRESSETSHSRRSRQRSDDTRERHRSSSRNPGRKREYYQSRRR